MLLLLPTFLFGGLELAYWSSVYGTAVANTRAFDLPSNTFFALNAICIGLGEFIGWPKSHSLLSRAGDGALEGAPSSGWRGRGRMCGAARRS